MNWIEQLCRVYDKQNEKGLNLELSPISHMYFNAQVEVDLDKKGTFLDARIVGKEDAKTLVPVTEASACRSGSAPFPHPLSDTLPYIAGDFGDFCEKEKMIKEAHAKNTAYLQQLKTWAETEKAPAEVKAVYLYLSKGTLAADLIEKSILELEEGVFSNKKINAQPYEKVLVRFRIRNKKGNLVGTWENESLIRAFIAYYQDSNEMVKDVCYATGEISSIGRKHPKGLLPGEFNAKLVSSNDSQGYTYRGLFREASEACSLSYETSQKMHSALRWLIQTQGIFIGDRVFICFNPDGHTVPDLFGRNKKQEEIKDQVDEDEILDEEEVLDEEEEQKKDQKKKQPPEYVSYQAMLKQALYGSGNPEDLAGCDDSVVIMGFESATPGRISIVYYQTLLSSDLLKRIQEWKESCCWFINHYKMDMGQIVSPSFKTIARCAYGEERKNGWIEMDKKYQKEVEQRFIKCMIDAQPLPYDIVRALVNKASNPVVYSPRNRELVLSTACAMLIKYRIDRKMTEKGEENMKLDNENNDRSYLFGRLLAVLERAERRALSKDEKREPNAIRYMSSFVHYPMRTWMILDGKLVPYLAKLGPEERNKYRSLINEIVVKIKEGDERKLNLPLDENYLLGYYLQRAEL